MEAKAKTEELQELADIKCQCGKIVAQQYKRKVYIKCRHCKRFIIIDAGAEHHSNCRIEYK